MRVGLSPNVLSALDKSSPGRPRRQDWIVNAERRRGRGAHGGLVNVIAIRAAVWSRGAFETVGRACISVGSPLFFPR